MTDQDFEKFIDSMTGAIVRLKAKMEANEIMLTVVGAKAGFDQKKLETTVHTLTEAIHQKLLEQAESLNPGLAAQIDFRKEFPDIPDALL
jgi:hypothetical protein